MTCANCDNMATHVCTRRPFGSAHKTAIYLCRSCASQYWEGSQGTCACAIRRINTQLDLEIEDKPQHSFFF